MANLRVLNEQPDRIVLGKGGTTGISGLVGIVIFGAIALIGLSALLGEGGGLDPVMVVIMLIVGFFVVIFLINTLAATRVTLDTKQRVVSRTNSFLFIPTGRQEMSFNLIRDVEVTQMRGARGIAPNSLPIWQTRLNASDGTVMALNERGTRAEMDDLAQRVSAYLNRPIREPRDANVSAQTSGATASAETPLDSLWKNLGLFAESFASPGEVTYTPPVSAFPSSSSPARQDVVERVAEESPYARASAQMAAQQAATTAGARQTNARMAAEQAATTAGAREANARMAAEQVAASADMNETTARMGQEQAAANADIQRTTAQMAQDQFATSAYTRQTNARMAADQVAASADVMRTSARMSAQQIAAGASVIGASAQLASQQVEAFSSDMGMQALTSAQLTAASLPFAAASLRLGQEQMEAEAAMRYSTPALLTMPQMATFASFAPVLDLPVFAPLGAEFAPSTIPEDAPQVKEVRAQVSSDLFAQLDARELVRQGRQQLGAKRFRDAQEFYVRALNVNPADPVAQNDLGVAYYEQRKLQEAERAFRRTIALDPFSSEGRYNLGLVLRQLGRRAEADEQFRVGAQQASRGATAYFQEALQGTLHAPLVKPQT